MEPSTAPPHHASLAIEVLGGRVHDDVRPQLQRLLQGRGAESVVHHQQDAAVVGQPGQRADVGDLGGGVGRAFDEQEAGFGPDGGLPRSQVVDLHIGGADVVALEQPQHADGGTKYGLRTDDVVPRPGQAHDHRMDGRHAGRSRHAGFCPFQRSQPVLEDPHGGIAKARIDETIDLARKLGRRMGRIVVHEAGAEIDGLGVLAIGAGVVAGTDRQRLGLHAGQTHLPGSPARCSHCRIAGGRCHA